MCYHVLSFPSGRELTHGHQLGLAGAVSLPVFWLAGAGAAVFWVLGEYPLSPSVMEYLGTGAAALLEKLANVDVLLICYKLIAKLIC